MAESSAELLEKAAARLEELAASVEGGPWRQHDFAGEPILLSKPSATDKTTWRTVIGDGVKPAVIEWVETMQPSVAAPLVELLRDVAGSMRKHRRPGPDGTTYWLETGPTSAYQRTALTIARAILGEPAEEDQHA